MSQRKSHTCVDCARRKIKCDKEIPCANCKKRGTAHSCRRGEPGRLSIGTSSIDQDLGTVQTSASRDSLNAAETTISLLRTLVDRVERLEASLHGAQKRIASDNTTMAGTEGGLKRVRTTGQPWHPPATTSNHEHSSTEDGPLSAQDESQTEAEEAATVLEFLAWGRVKDASFADTMGKSPEALEPKAFAEKETFQAMKPWNCALPSSPAPPSEYCCTETALLKSVQEALPSQVQVLQMVEFHNEWLLWSHQSFQAPAIVQALNDFYNMDRGLILPSSSKLQWAALLFAILSGTAGCAKPEHMMGWGFREEEHELKAKLWYQTTIECMNAARYQQNHNLCSVQAVTTLMICAHIIDLSNTQSILFASAIRIAQSLGLHRLKGEKEEYRFPTNDRERESHAQLETGRRVWQQLLTQDWFSVPFSETYSVNPLHTTSKRPLNIDDNTFELMPSSHPTMTSYGNFMNEIASLMPRLQDKLLQAPTLNMKYEQVIHFDQKMRDLVTTKLPSCLRSQVPLDPGWPRWVELARRTLTITSAHKIMMIHRRFLGISLFDNRFEFTRKTCLAAAKTIINEVKQAMPAGSPNIWIFQTFTVAAAIILTLDNFYRPQSSREYQEHRNLVTETLRQLSSTSVSTVAVRGRRLLIDLYNEELGFRSRDGEKFRERGYRAPKQGGESLVARKDSKSLDVAAFVKKFRESDQPQGLHTSPSIGAQLPLWLYDSSTWPHPDYYQREEDLQSNYGPGPDGYSSMNSVMSHPPLRSQLVAPRQPQFVQQGEIFTYPFGHGFIENSNAHNLQLFNNLLGIPDSQMQ